MEQKIIRKSEVHGLSGRVHGKADSSVAWHLALFAAVQRRVVKKSAAFTVPLSAFKILIPLYDRRLN